MGSDQLKRFDVSGKASDLAGSLRWRWRSALLVGRQLWLGLEVTIRQRCDGRGWMHCCEAQGRKPALLCLMTRRSDKDGMKAAVRKGRFAKKRRQMGLRLCRGRKLVMYCPSRTGIMLVARNLTVWALNKLRQVFSTQTGIDWPFLLETGWLVWRHLWFLGL